MLHRIQQKKIDFYSGAYASPEENTESDQSRLKIVSNMVGENKIILDIGCFTGNVGSIFLKRSNVVFGMDLSMQALETARTRGVDVVLADADEQLPFRDHSFDVVFAGELIEHVLDVGLLLKEVKRVIRPDGEIVLTTPNLASLGRRLLLLVGKDPLTNIKWFSGAGHLRYFVKETLLRLLKEYDFEIIELKSDIVNFSLSGGLHSVKLAQWFPSIGRGLIVKCRCT